MSTRSTATGRRLQEWRAKRGMTQIALAQHLGINRQRLWDWEQHGVPTGDVPMLVLAMQSVSRQLDASKTF